MVNPPSPCILGTMSRASESETRGVVDWGAGERRRRRLEAELERIVARLPSLGVRRAILFGSLARGDVGGHSDLDLILIADSGEPFLERGARFYRALAPAVGMDLLVYTREEFEAMRHGGFLRRALAEGTVLYEA
jgi:predicted nucleotidyltransferase